MSESKELPRQAEPDPASPAQPPELKWKQVASECPICGWEMVLVNGFHRCKNCGYKEPCCWA